MNHTEQMRKDGIKTENKFIEITKDFYKDAMDNGNGELFISELIKK